MNRPTTWLISIVLVVLLVAAGNAQISRVKGDYAASLLMELCAAAFMLGCIVCLVCSTTVGRMGWVILGLSGLLAIVVLGDGITRVLPG
jgi:hypothetical protein